jgi:hypothetical protein
MSKEMIPIERIARAIYILRGQKVLLDSDLAALYGVSTKALNQAVKRNPERFPPDFIFHLRIEETRSLRSQFVTLKRGEHVKYRPYAFTEQGLAMLSSVLKNMRTGERTRLACWRWRHRQRELSLSLVVPDFATRSRIRFPARRVCPPTRRA